MIGRTNSGKGKEKEEQEKTVTIRANGTTYVTPDADKVLSRVTVNTSLPIQSKTTNITTNGTIYVTPDAGYTSMNQVTINTNVSPSLGNAHAETHQQQSISFSVTAGKLYSVIMALGQVNNDSYTFNLANVVTTKLTNERFPSNNHLAFLVTTFIANETGTVTCTPNVPPSGTALNYTSMIAF